MMHGRNNGKKLMAVRIVAHAFEIVRTLRALQQTVWKNDTRLSISTWVLSLHLTNKQSSLQIHLMTDQNPIQVAVDAIVNCGPREDSTRIGSAGTVRRQAVDVSP